MESLTVEELKKSIDRGVAHTLLDVREPWEYELCCIDGSINIPMADIINREKELDHNRDIVVICHHGSRSFQVACYLENTGFKKKIMNLEGGIDAWADSIDKLMPKY